MSYGFHELFMTHRVGMYNFAFAGAQIALILVKTLFKNEGALTIYKASHLHKLQLMAVSQTIVKICIDD